MYRSVTGFATLGQAKLETFLSLNFSPKMGIQEPWATPSTAETRRKSTRHRRAFADVDTVVVRLSGDDGGGGYFSLT